MADPNDFIPDATPAPQHDDFVPDVAHDEFVPDAPPAELTPHQGYRASVKALAAGSPEQPAGVGAPQPTDYTTERVPPAELAKQWGDVAYGAPKGAAAFPVGGFMGDIEAQARHLVGANPETYFPTTIEGGYLGPKGAGLMNPAATPEEAIGMGVGAMLLPGPKMLRAIKGEKAPPVPPAMPPALLPERNPFGVTLTEGRFQNDPVKIAEEQRLIRQLDPHAQQFMEQNSSQLAQAPLEAAPQLDSLGQVPAGSSIQAADYVANALDQHQDVVNQQLQTNTNLLAAAHKDLHNKLSPTGTTLAQDPMEAADVIQGAVDNEAQRAILAKNQAYKALEDSDVVFHPAAFNNAGNKMRALVDKADKIDINPETTPISNQAINKVDSILSSLVQKRDEVGQILPNEPITPRTLEDVRKRLNVFMGQAKASAQAGKPSDAIAMRSVIDAFDDLVEDRVAKGTVTQGNPLDALSQMRYARGLNTAYRKAFTPQGPGDAVGQSIQKILGRYDGQAATPEQIQGMMYNPKNPLSVKIANRLKSMFGETTPEFGAAKQGFNSFLTERPPGGEAWGPEQIAARIDQYTRGPGRTLTQAYLSPQEISRLQTLGKASRQHANDLVAGESPFEGVDWQTTFRQAVNGSKKAVSQIDEALTRVGPTSPAGSTVRQGLFFNALQPVQGVEKWGFKQKADNLVGLLQSTRNSAVYGPEHRQVIKSYIDMLRKLETPKGIYEPSGPAVDRLKLGIERGVGQLIGYTVARHIPGAGLAMDLIGMRLGGEGASFLARKNVNKIRTQLPIVADEMQKWQRAQARAAKNSNWATNQGTVLATTLLQKSLAPLGIDLSKLPLQLPPGTRGAPFDLRQLQGPGSAAAEPDQQPKQRADGGATDDNPDAGSNFVTKHTAPFPEKPEGYEYIEAKGAGADTPGPATPSLSNGLETPVGTFLAHNPSPNAPTPDNGASDLPSPTGAEGGPGLPNQPAGSHIGPQTGMQKLFGVNGPRYQTWPEKMVRSGTTLAHDVGTGEEPDYTGLRREDFTDIPGDAQPMDSMIQRSQDMTALAGGSGFASAEEGALGMAGGKLPQPDRYLIPAIKVGDKIYKGLLGSDHPDIPKMYGLDKGFPSEDAFLESLPENAFGFINHKGHFLERGDAGEYAADNQLVAPQYADMIRKVGLTADMLLSDTSKPGAALSALEHSQQPFYSTVENAIASAPQQKMHASQWAGWLKNQPGVKGEEMDWLGLNDPKQMPTDAKGMVNKDELLQHVQGQGVGLKEVEKSGAPSYDRLSPTQQKSVMKEFQEYIGSLGDFNKEYPTQQERQEAVRAWYRDFGYGEQGSPKYGPEQAPDLSLPGGENYREMLLTMPSKELPLSTYKVGPAAGNDGFAVFDQNGKQISGGVLSKREAQGLADQWAANPRPPQGPEFRSSHWDEPNVLAHMRMNDRNIPGVGKALHLEEAQSDLHQKGRKEGYSNPNYKLRVEVIDNPNPGEAPYLVMVDGRPTGAFFTKGEATQHADYVAQTPTSTKGVPNMPFKTTWPDLLLKRAITKAARENYDAVSWTPGEQQAARYDLSKQVSRVTLTKMSNRNEQFLQAYDHSNREVINKAISDPAKELPDIVGKDAAEKLLRQEPQMSGGVSQRALSGIDLKVGGSGMRSFYDKMLVDKANAIGKKYGAKVEWKDLPGQVKYHIDEFNDNSGHGFTVIDSKTGKEIGHPFETHDAANKYVNGLTDGQNSQIKVPVLRLTPQLKEQALSRGMPLFSDTSKPGAALSALEKTKQVTDAKTGTQIVPVSGKFKAAASYIDPKGYTVTIKAYKKPDGQHGPQGEIHIATPSGKTVESTSTWMDYPEPGWKYKGTDLYKDWVKHEKSETGNSSIWRTKVPLETRLRMEAKQQGISEGDYGPLKDQYKEYKGHAADALEEAKHPYKQMSDAELHKYLWGKAPETNSNQ
jgi:hypothetical protein